MKKLTVAIIGYGKSGGGIHGGFFKSKNNDIVNVVAVAELDPERAKVAKADYNCDTYSDYRELFKRDDIDLVVNSSYSDMHYPITLDVINHGFNVLCEKPITKTAEELRELIAAAKKNNVVFTIFQQSRLTAYFEKMEEIIKQYEDDKPFSSCLILGMSIGNKFIHVVVSTDNDFIYLITAYIPNKEQWEDDLKTRKGR